MIHDGETTSDDPSPDSFRQSEEYDKFISGVMLGLLIGEGHFGGDGRQPQVTLRMHVRHERLFRWLVEKFPGGKLYGPYSHGGRHYFQWMFRGKILRDYLIPLLDSLPFAEIDTHAYSRYTRMREKYNV